MKRINIQKDVDSRRKIASKELKTIVYPTKTEVKDAKREEAQGSEIHQKSSESAPAIPKRGRKTKGNSQEV